MLTHPFFGRELDEFFPDFIKNGDFIFTIFESEAKWRKLELMHEVKVEFLVRLKD